jgi:hypothetical protein
MLCTIERLSCIFSKALSLLERTIGSLSTTAQSLASKQKGCVGLGALLIVFVSPKISERALADDPNALEKWGKTYEEKVWPIIQAKCISCHSGATPDGELDLSRFPNGETAVNAGDAWERVAKRVRLNEMPPQGSPGLIDPEKSAFHRWVDARPNQDLCHQLASDETQSWYRGYVMSRRLSRYEYGCAIRDLTGFHVPDELLPPSDGAGGLGFDTVGDALFTSPIHLEAYLRTSHAAVHALFEEGDSIEPVRERLARLGFTNSFSSLTQDQRSIEPHAQLAAAREILAQFARRAWRRYANDSELDRLMRLFALAREDRNRSGAAPSQSTADFLSALQQPFQAILVSPHFLFVAEPEPETAGVQRLAPYQLATRMALLVWSSLPDEELLEIAESGLLFEPHVIQSQLRRMLQDDRARALGENFGLQWLGLRDWKSSRPDKGMFPEFEEVLMSDAIEETVRTIQFVFSQGRPLTDLLDSSTIHINARLARHYGVEWPILEQDNAWHKIEVANGQRGGIMTMASVLIKASYPHRTSPVLRGRWILDDVLGAKVPPPPPNVPSLEESSHGLTTASLRERLEVHRKNPDCAVCHQRMDPLGFGLENYDAIGRWRTEDQGLPIDASGSLPSGETFQGPAELKRVLMNRKDEFQLHAIRKLIGFALGRDLNKFDQCVIDASTKRLQEEQRADVVLEEILMSYPFQHRYYNPAKGSQ